MVVIEEIYEDEGGNVSSEMQAPELANKAAESAKNDDFEIVENRKLVSQSNAQPIVIIDGSMGMDNDAKSNDESTSNETSFVFLSIDNAEHFHAGSNVATSSQQVEYEEKMSKVLLENKTLKEKLKQHQKQMQDEFYLLIVLESQLRKISENYKAKFSEATKKIYELKYKCADLDEKVKSNNKKASKKQKSSSSELTEKLTEQNKSAGDEKKEEPPKLDYSKSIDRIGELRNKIQMLQILVSEMTKNQKEFEVKQAKTRDHLKKQLKQSREEIEGLKKLLKLYADENDQLKMAQISELQEIEMKYINGILHYLIDQINTQMKEKQLENKIIALIEGNKKATYPQKISALTGVFLNYCMDLDVKLLSKRSLEFLSRFLIVRCTELLKKQKINKPTTSNEPNEEEEEVEPCTSEQEVETLTMKEKYNKLLKRYNGLLSETLLLQTYQKKLAEIDERIANSMKKKKVIKTNKATLVLTKKSQVAATSEEESLKEQNVKLQQELANLKKQLETSAKKDPMTKDQQSQVDNESHSKSANSVMIENQFLKQSISKLHVSMSKLQDRCDNECKELEAVQKEVVLAKNYIALLKSNLKESMEVIEIYMKDNEELHEKVKQLEASNNATNSGSQLGQCKAIFDESDEQ